MYNIHWLSLDTWDKVETVWRESLDLIWKYCTKAGDDSYRWPLTEMVVLYDESLLNVDHGGPIVRFVASLEDFFGFTVDFNRSAFAIEQARRSHQKSCLP